MFDTLLGSVIILLAIGGIIFAFAVFTATLSIWIQRKDDLVAVSAVQEPSSYPLRRAA